MPFSRIGTVSTTAVAGEAAAAAVAAASRSNTINRTILVYVVVFIAKRANAFCACCDEWFLVVVC